MISRAALFRDCRRERVVLIFVLYYVCVCLFLFFVFPRNNEKTFTRCRRPSAYILMNISVFRLFFRSFAISFLQSI